MLYITEYAKLDNLLPIEPGLRTQTLAVSDSSVQSEPLNPSTRAIRVYAEETCLLAFGDDPNATKGGYPVAAGSTGIIGVTGGQKVAVIGLQNATGSRDDAFLKAIADAPATMARAKELADKTAAYNKAAADAKAATEDAKIKLAVLAAKQVDIETRMHALEAARVEAARQRAALDLEKGEFEKRVKMHSDLESAWRISRDAAGAALLKERAEFEEARKNALSATALTAKEYSKWKTALDEREAALKAAEDDYEQRMAALENIGRRKKAS